ncbi:MAG: haloacid dehalogenase-like hydrolase [Nitrospina sp.]|jgi:hypothetical protein|nr:haloacid dehalogenase-like hydrolase [Nitrospina sp.]
MAKKLIPLAIAYDFDGTLTPGNMQEHSFIPNLGVSKKKFWSMVKEHSKKHDMDEILAYMDLMIHMGDSKSVRIDKKSFIDHGRGLCLFDGVEDWFHRINRYGKSIGLKVQHYIISSGLREMIEGTKIAKKFSYIFASGFRYDQHGVAKWPALAINYTTKTQYLFRINKGIPNSYDNEKVNKYIPDSDRPVPFSNIIYIGDGETDIPCMKMVKYQGGFSVAVYDPKKRKSLNKSSPKDKCMKLRDEGRADYVQPADYREGKKLDLLVRAILDKVVAEAHLSKLVK